MLDDGERRDEEQPRDAERDRDEEDPVERPLDEPEDAEGGEFADARDERARGEPRHRLRAREAEELRDGDERVAARAERVDERPERGDGLAPVAAAVVQEHDVAAVPLGERGVDDHLHARRAPILAVEVHADGEIAAIARDRDGHELVVGGRLGVAEVRRAEERGAPAEDRLEEPLGRVELQLRLQRVGEEEIRVREGVIPDLVPFAPHPAQQRDVRLDVLADDEEGRRRAARLEGVEDRGGPAAVGPVVEGERDAVREAVAVAVVDVRRGVGHDLLPDDEPGGGIDGDLAPPLGGARHHLDDLALTIARQRLGVVAGGDRVELG